MKKKLLPLIFLVFISCEAIFTEDISDLSVKILAPQDNTEIDEGLIQFNWEVIVDATEYHIQIATPDFTNASQILLDSINNTNSISKNLTVGKYQWRVKAKNSGYQTSYTSASFEIK